MNTITFGPMLIVDTQCHVGLNWFEPVEMLVFQMDRNDVEKAILIQYWGMHHNEYLMECMQHFPGRFGAVICIDPSDPQAIDHLEKAAENPGVVGLRLKTSVRSPGDDPYLIWRRTGELDLAISCYTYDVAQTSDPAFHELVAAVPNTRIALEHLAGMHPGHKNGDPSTLEPPYTGYKAALELAKFPNTYIKFAGFGEFSPRPPVFKAEFGFDEIPPLLDMAYEAFGASRMMWGSDHPPVSKREGYQNALVGPQEYGLFSGQDELDWAFGKTAASVWRNRG